MPDDFPTTGVVACPRRSLPAGAEHRATALYSVDPLDPNHDAVMRIGGEAPRAVYPFSRSA